MEPDLTPIQPPKAKQSYKLPVLKINPQKKFGMMAYFTNNDEPSMFSNCDKDDALSYKNVTMPTIPLKKPKIIIQTIKKVIKAERQKRVKSSSTLEEVSDTVMEVKCFNFILSRLAQMGTKYTYDKVHIECEIHHSILSMIRSRFDQSLSSNSMVMPAVEEYCISKSVSQVSGAQLDTPCLNYNFHYLNYNYLRRNRIYFVKFFS